MHTDNMHKSQVAITHDSSPLASRKLINSLNVYLSDIMRVKTALTSSMS